MPRVVINAPGEVMAAAVVKEIKEVLLKTITKTQKISLALSGNKIH